MAYPIKDEEAESPFQDSRRHRGIKLINLVTIKPGSPKLYISDPSETVSASDLVSRSPAHGPATRVHQHEDATSVTNNVAISDYRRPKGHLRVPGKNRSTNLCAYRKLLGRTWRDDGGTTAAEASTRPIRSSSCLGQRPEVFGDPLYVCTRKCGLTFWY